MKRQSYWPLSRWNLFRRNCFCSFSNYRQ